jgi:hypothetical protein
LRGAEKGVIIRAYQTKEKNQMTETNYRVIGFGTNEFGFFNQLAYTSSPGYAYGFYQEHIADCEMTGAVIIKVNHESWEVIEEFGTDGVSVAAGPWLDYKVVPAEKLEMVGV